MSESPLEIHYVMLWRQYIMGSIVIADDWLLISLPILPQIPGKPLLLHPTTTTHGVHDSKLHGSHVVGTRVWGTDGKVGA